MRGSGRVLQVGKGNSNSRGERPVHLIISMIKWIRTSRLSIRNSLPPNATADETPQDQSISPRSLTDYISNFSLQGV